MLHAAVLIIAAALLIFFSGSRAFACTGFAAGKKASSDGSLIIGRTEDISAFHPKRFAINEAQHGEGMRRLTDPVNGFSIGLPVESCRWTMVRDIPAQGDGLYPEACMNEYGVCISATVSTGVNEWVQMHDPLVSNGLREAYLPCTVIPYVRTAREGVLRLGTVIEQYGSAEGNTVLLADRDEAWIMEIVSGHQWAAQRVPDDCCAIIPNCMMLGYIDISDKENYLCSKNLFALPAEKGFLKMHEGRAHVALTYGPSLSEGNRVRAWGGREFLASNHALPYDSELFPLFFRPDQPLTLMQCMRALGCRYEGTEHDANLTRSRAIGTETTCEAHLFALRKDLPPLQWLCMGTADHGLFIPCYEGITSAPQQLARAEADYAPDSAYWMCRTLSALCAAYRPMIGAGVQDKLDEYQQLLIEETHLTDIHISSVCPAERSAYADRLFKEQTDRTLALVEQINHELLLWLTLRELPVLPQLAAALAHAGI